MKHPAEYWIKYLILRGHSSEEIKGMCEMIGLGAVTGGYIEHLADKMKQGLPVPFHPSNRQHKTSQQYLHREGVYDAWHKTLNMRRAIALLSIPEVRALVETFILSPLKPRQALKKIKERVDFTMQEKVYALYRHYFWNSNLLSGSEWGQYARQREIAHRDWLKLAVTARGPEGVRLVLWKTGTGSNRNLTPLKIFEDLRNIAYMKAKELEHRPATMENSTAFNNYVRAAKISQEEVSNSAGSAKDVLASFQAFKMRHAEFNAPSVDQLTGGNFTDAVDVTVTSDDIDY